MVGDCRRTGSSDCFRVSREAQFKPCYRGYMAGNERHNSPAHRLCSLCGEERILSKLRSACPLERNRGRAFDFVAPSKWESFLRTLFHGGVEGVHVEMEDDARHGQERGVWFVKREGWKQGQLPDPRYLIPDTRIDASGIWDLGSASPHHPSQHWPVR